MPLRQVTVKAPATTANLGPGFDVFGLALQRPNDKVKLTLVPEGVKIVVSGLSAAASATQPEKSPAGIVANHMLREFSLEAGVKIEIERCIFPSVGLGSSAASAAAVAYGLNHLCNLGLDNRELIRLAAKGEVASAGSEHADNVAAAICGHFVIVKSYKPLEIVNLKSPPNMEVCVAFPHIPASVNKTRKARSVVPKLIRIDQLVHNVGKAAVVASGFATGDVDMIGKSMLDAVVEPARAFLIPGYLQVRENALRAGACGVAISGAGPAIIAVANNKKVDTAKVAAAMKEGFGSAGFEATAFATKPGGGVSIVEME
ncbi:MAG: homoserine kinase [Candidatus Bathyarchaeota archaeon]|nr:homoserine kinase [Candidatus Bathyarchaeota archaeon]